MFGGNDLGDEVLTTVKDPVSKVGSPLSLRASQSSWRESSSNYNVTIIYLPAPEQAGAHKGAEAGRRQPYLPLGDKSVLE